MSKRKIYNPKTTQIEPGKWYRLDNPEATECCDCALVHHTEYALYQGRLIFRTTGDRRLTNRRRKEAGIKLEKVPAPPRGAGQVQDS